MGETSLHRRNALEREPVQLRHRRIHQTTSSGSKARKPKDKDKGSEENKQFDPGGKTEKLPLWNAAVMVLSFFFLGGALGHGRLVVFASCSLSLCACL